MTSLIADYGSHNVDSKLCFSFYDLEELSDVPDQYFWPLHGGEMSSRIMSMVILQIPNCPCPIYPVNIESFETNPVEQRNLLEMQRFPWAH
jgi:hypothetical protein